MDMDEYNLVYDLSKACVDLCKGYSKALWPTKTRELLLALFQLLRISYKKGDYLQGVSNLQIVIELIGDKDLPDTLNNYFDEIVREVNYDVNVFIAIFQNIVNTGITTGGCTIIHSISENYKNNSAWSCIFDIFIQVILKYMIPKVKIPRCSHAVVKLLEFYLLGFLKVFPTTQDILAQLADNLRFLALHNYKEPKRWAGTLKEYADFLYVYIVFAENNSNSSMFGEIKSQLDDIRKEFDLLLSEKEKANLRETVKKNWIFDITEQDLKSQWKLSPLEVLIQKFQSDEKHKGLCNLGNTCYINSTIQALFMTMRFRESVLGLHKIHNSSTTSVTSSLKKSTRGTPTPKDKDMITEESTCSHDELCNLFFQLVASPQKFIDPTAFRHSLPPDFRDSYLQQDASEFFKLYLDQLEKSLKDTPYKNLINECFAGEYEDTIECLECQNPVQCKQKFLDIPLSFDQESKEEHDMRKMILQSYQPEEFTDKNKYYCETCKKQSNVATKNSKLVFLPEYLILTLNRFLYDHQTQKRNKITSYVNLYESFDFKDIFGHEIQGGTAYRMYAIVVHSGYSADQGHYYTFARELNNPKMWFLFNDKMVLALGDLNLTEYFKENEYETPYMIFYKRENWSNGKELRH